MTWKVRWRIKEPVKKELKDRYRMIQNYLGVISGTLLSTEKPGVRNPGL